MKKVLTAALASALGLSLAAPAFATDTRINSLSAGGVALTPTLGFNEKTITIRDTANIYVLPQMMVTYKNSVDVDATAGASYGTMNIRYALSDDSVLLLYGKRSPWLPVTKQQTINGQNAADIAGYAPAPKDPTNHQFGIGFGMKAGESLRLGTHLSIGGHRVDGDNNTQNNNTLVQFGAGVGFDLNETNNLDFGLDLKFGSFVNKAQGGDFYTPNGLFAFTLVGKGEFQVHQIAKVVPYLNFNYDNRSVAHAARGEDPGAQAKNGTATNTTVALGSDLAIAPVENVLIQPGVGLAFVNSFANGNNISGQQSFDKDNANRIAPYYGFAAEAKAFEWLVLRLGARQTIVLNNKANTLPPPQSNESHTSDVVNRVTTGFGLRLMGWEMDLNVDPTFYNNGLNAITGNTTGGWAADWALSYKW